MPTMPSPPAAVTAAASRPPATPPIGALTIGTRKPMPRDHGVDSTGLRRGKTLEDGQHDDRIVDGLKGVPLRGNHHVVAGLSVPHVATGGDVNVPFEDLQ